MKNTPKSLRKQNQRGRAARGPAPGIPRRTIAVDLGFERSAYCILNQAGEVVEEEWMLTTRATLRARWGGEEEKGRVVMEACGLSTWVREEFVALGYEVVEDHPGRGWRGFPLRFPGGVLGGLHLPSFSAAFSKRTHHV